MKDCPSKLNEEHQIQGKPPIVRNDNTMLNPLYFMSAPRISSDRAGPRATWSSEGTDYRRSRETLGAGGVFEVAMLAHGAPAMAKARPSAARRNYHNNIGHSGSRQRVGASCDRPKMKRASPTHHAHRQQRQQQHVRHQLKRRRGLGAPLLDLLDKRQARHRRTAARSCA